VIVGLSPSFILAMIACVLVGLSSSMLWPGTLILMEEKFPAPGVAAYALMAAGGDFGASIAPQLLGIVVDTISASELAVSLGNTLSLSAEQVGMKCGMLVAALFPIIGTVLIIFMNKYFRKNKNNA
jgi:fucose permease